MGISKVLITSTHHACFFFNKKKIYQYLLVEKKSLIQSCGLLIIIHRVHTLLVACILGLEGHQRF